MNRAWRKDVGTPFPCVPAETTLDTPAFSILPLQLPVEVEKNENYDTFLPGPPLGPIMLQ